MVSPSPSALSSDVPLCDRHPTGVVRSADPFSAQLPSLAARAAASSPMLLTAARRSLGLIGAIRLAAKPAPALSLPHFAPLRRVQRMGAQTSCTAKAQSTRKLHSAIGVAPRWGAYSPLPVKSRLAAPLVFGSRGFHFVQSCNANRRHPAKKQPNRAGATATPTPSTPADSSRCSEPSSVASPSVPPSLVRRLLRLPWGIVEPRSPGSYRYSSGLLERRTYGAYRFVTRYDGDAWFRREDPRAEYRAAPMDEFLVWMLGYMLGRMTANLMFIAGVWIIFGLAIHNAVTDNWVAMMARLPDEESDRSIARWVGWCWSAESCQILKERVAERWWNTRRRQQRKIEEGERKAAKSMTTPASKRA